VQDFNTFLGKLRNRYNNPQGMKFWSIVLGAAEVGPILDSEAPGGLTADDAEGFMERRDEEEEDEGQRTPSIKAEDDTMADLE
jgi:hypothetical protein